MKAEHCSMEGCNDHFATSNAERTTWPANEWAITAEDDHERAHPSSTRILQKIKNLEQCDVAQNANLMKCYYVLLSILFEPINTSSRN
jgi:hypothetical protein